MRRACVALCAAQVLAIVFSLSSVYNVLVFKPPARCPHDAHDDAHWHDRMSLIDVPAAALRTADDGHAYPAYYKLQRVCARGKDHGAALLACGDDADADLSLSATSASCAAAALLFVPGHGGWGAQGNVLFGEISTAVGATRLRACAFAVDFDGELSAFSGAILERQVAFVRVVLHALAARRVVIVGHSMGGAVAAAALGAEGARSREGDSGAGEAASSVDVLVALASPLVQPPLPVFASEARAFGALHLHAARAFDIERGGSVLVSLAGGRRDSQVIPAYTRLPHAHVTATAASVAGVFAVVEHNDMVTCGPLVERVADTLVATLALENTLSTSVRRAQLAALWGARFRPAIRPGLLDPVAPCASASDVAAQPTLCAQAFERSDAAAPRAPNGDMVVELAHDARHVSPACTGVRWRVVTPCASARCSFLFVSSHPLVVVRTSLLHESRWVSSRALDADASAGASAQIHVLHGRVDVHDERVRKPLVLEVHVAAPSSQCGWFQYSLFDEEDDGAVRKRTLALSESVLTRSASLLRVPAYASQLLVQFDLEVACEAAARDASADFAPFVVYADDAHGEGALLRLDEVHAACLAAGRASVRVPLRLDYMIEHEHAVDLLVLWSARSAEHWRWSVRLVWDVWATAGVTFRIFMYDFLPFAGAGLFAALAWSRTVRSTSRAVWIGCAVQAATVLLRLAWHRVFAAAHHSEAALAAAGVTHELMHGSDLPLLLWLFLWLVSVGAAGVLVVVPRVVALSARLFCCVPALCLRRVACGAQARARAAAAAAPVLFALSWLLSGSLSLGIVCATLLAPSVRALLCDVATGAVDAQARRAAPWRVYARVLDGVHVLLALYHALPSLVAWRTDGLTDDVSALQVVLFLCAAALEPLLGPGEGLELPFSAALVVVGWPLLAVPGRPYLVPVCVTYVHAFLLAFYAKRAFGASGVACASNASAPLSTGATDSLASRAARSGEMLTRRFVRSRCGGVLARLSASPAVLRTRVQLRRWAAAVGTALSLSSQATAPRTPDNELGDTRSR